MKKREPLVIVKASTWRTVLLNIFWIPLNVILLLAGIVSKDGMFFCFFIVALGFCIHSLADYKNRKIIVLKWGIAVCDWMGNVRMVKYDEISAVKITTWIHPNPVRLEVDGTIIVTFYSSDVNFSEFMKILYSEVPQAISWKASS